MKKGFNVIYVDVAHTLFCYVYNIIVLALAEKAICNIPYRIYVQ